MKDRCNRLKAARHLLGIPESATLAMIKSAYRRLLSHWHPDRHPEDVERATEMTRQVVDAYQLLLDYCHLYRYDFSDGEIQRQQSGDDWWTARFGDDPLWGPSRQHNEPDEDSSS